MFAKNEIEKLMNSAVLLSYIRNNEGPSPVVTRNLYFKRLKNCHGLLLFGSYKSDAMTIC